MPDKLLPCPFCGSKAKLDSYSDGIFVVTCSRYCVSLPQGGAVKEDAIRKWNHRTNRPFIKCDDCDEIADYRYCSECMDNHRS